MHSFFKIAIIILFGLNPIISNTQISLDTLVMCQNKSHIDVVEGACFNINNKYLATFSSGGTSFYVWDIKTNKFLKQVYVKNEIENIFSDKNEHSFIIKFRRKAISINVLTNKQLRVNYSKLGNKKPVLFSEIKNHEVVNNLKKIGVYNTPTYGNWQEYIIKDKSIRIVTDLVYLVFMSLDGSQIISIHEMDGFPIRKFIFSDDFSKLCLINAALGDAGKGNKYVSLLNLSNPSSINELQPSSINLFSLSINKKATKVYSTTDSSIFYFNINNPMNNKSLFIKGIYDFSVDNEVYLTSQFFLENDVKNSFIHLDSILMFKNQISTNELLITPLEIPVEKNVIVSNSNGCNIYNSDNLSKQENLNFAENYCHNPIYDLKTKKIYMSSENKIYEINLNDKKTISYEIFNFEEWDPMSGPNIVKFFIDNSQLLYVFLSNGTVYKKYLDYSKSIEISRIKNFSINDVEIHLNYFIISGTNLKNQKGCIYKLSMPEPNDRTSLNCRLLKEFDFFIPSIEISNNTLFLNSIDKIFVLDLKQFKIIYSFETFKNNNWMVKLPNSPYYMCSKDASKMLHYVTPSLKVIGFEQLDPVYNRPDIVLDSIGKYFGNSDRGMIDNYRIIWDKRIDRLGLDKEKLGKGEIAVPSAEIIGAENIAFENKDGKLDLTVSANDLKYPLRRFNVFVNEVPLYGSAGISIAHLKKHKWDTVVSVPLSFGDNKIQVSVMNELGLENFKYPTYVNYIPGQNIVSKTYFIGIGVNEFIDSKHNLKYCVKDVTDLSKRLKDSNSIVKLFTNSAVTRENILLLKDFLNKNTTVNDKVIISCSSHGLLDDSLNFFLAMHDVDFDNPKTRGLKYEELENHLDGIPARQKLLLLDACNSGENDKTDILKQELKHNEKNMDTIHLFATRSREVNFEEKNKSNFKKMNELFVNVRNNTGAVIISAAGGQESALEAIEVDGEEIENGAFTYSILECLELNKGKELKVNQLKNYTEKRVEQITKGKQIPTSRQETMEIDWIVR